MRPDVIELKGFYDSRAGMIAARLVRAALHRLMPDVSGLSVLGLGYAAPYLRLFEGQAERTLALMPAGQGALAWPAGGPRRAALIDESELPLADESVDRVLLVHELEFSLEREALLREVWRVLAAGGRIVAVVPNRAGLWARTERTPWGQGQPFSPGQIGALLRERLFMPTGQGFALYLPPLRSRLLGRAAYPLERLAVRWQPPLGGVMLIEAEKQIYAARPEAARGGFRARRRFYLPAAPGGAAPMPRQSAAAPVPPRARALARARAGLT